MAAISDFFKPLKIPFFVAVALTIAVETAAEAQEWSAVTTQTGAAILFVFLTGAVFTVGRWRSWW